mmetsp:Transcript_4119/g.11606  ORF Transcript_4119/g.11606 Transcript_4119/m.11606 type:complete len:95 (-) Transcript_4119:2170-2454(-)
MCHSWVLVSTSDLLGMLQDARPAVPETASGAEMFIEPAVVHWSCILHPAWKLDKTNSEAPNGPADSSQRTWTKRFEGTSPFLWGCPRAARGTSG